MLEESTFTEAGKTGGEKTKNKMKGMKLVTRRQEEIEEHRGEDEKGERRAKKRRKHK